MRLNKIIRKSLLVAFFAVLSICGCDILATQDTYATQACMDFDYHVTGKGVFHEEIDRIDSTRKICAEVNDEGKILDVAGDVNGSRAANVKQQGGGAAGLPDLTIGGTIGKILHIDCVPGLSSMVASNDAHAKDCDESISIHPGDSWNDLVHKVYDIIPDQYKRGDFDTGGKALIYERQGLKTTSLVEGGVGTSANSFIGNGGGTLNTPSGYDSQEHCLNGNISNLISQALDLPGVDDNIKKTLQRVQHQTDNYNKRKTALITYLDSAKRYLESRPRGISNEMRTTIESMQAQVSVLETDTCPNDNSAYQDSSTVATATGNKCYENAGPIGWIVCPVTDFLFDTLNWVFGIMERDYLKINASDIFTDNTNEGVYAAWSAFRDIANIFFIILLIVVILSQLTGFGIDNYGVKKILPKLVIVAVLINLSYIICQLAVDISNIVGVSLREFLVSLAPPLSETAQNPQGTEGWVFAGVLGTGLAIGASLAFVGTGMVLAILGAVISAVVGAFFLWVILIIRQAGVVLAIVLAPLAITCYLLPNTQSLGKRWLDISKALLLLYPICSLVIGAGALASSILGNVDNDGMRLAAMLVQVIPFFFIPTLLKQSLAGMGNLGAKLSGIGRAAGAKGNAGFRNAAGKLNFVKNIDENAPNRRMGMLNRVGKWGRQPGRSLPGRAIGKVIGGSAQTQQRRSRYTDKWEQEAISGYQKSWTDANGNINLDAAQAAFADLNGKKHLNDNERAQMRAAMNAITMADPTKAMRILTGEEQIKNSKGNTVALDANLRQQAGAYATSINPQLMGQMKEEDRIRADYVASMADSEHGLDIAQQSYVNWAYDTIIDAQGNTVTHAQAALNKATDSEIAKQKAKAIDNIQADALRSNGRHTRIASDTRVRANARSDTFEAISKI